jgi:hypothetical protein
MASSGGSSNCSPGSVERCVHENVPKMAWARDRSDGTPTIAEGHHGIVDSLRLFSISAIPFRLLLVLASFEPSKSRDPSVGRLRKLAGAPRVTHPDSRSSLAICRDADSCMCSTWFLRLGLGAPRETTSKDTMRSILDRGCNC